MAGPGTRPQSAEAQGCPTRSEVVCESVGNSVCLHCNQLVAKTTYWEHQQLSRFREPTRQDSSSSESDFEPVHVQAQETACTQPNGNPDNSGHLKETGNGSQRSDLDVDDDYSAPGTEIANVTR